MLMGKTYTKMNKIVISTQKSHHQEIFLKDSWTWNIKVLVAEPSPEKIKKHLSAKRFFMEEIDFLSDLLKNGGKKWIF